jgi:hypothetical protein
VVQLESRHVQQSEDEPKNSGKHRYAMRQPRGPGSEMLNDVAVLPMLGRTSFASSQAQTTLRLGAVAYGFGRQEGLCDNILIERARWKAP